MELRGLTDQQVKICDALWECETNEDVRIYVRSLPQRLQQEAVVLMDMMVLGAIDDEVNEMTVYPDAEKILAKVKKSH